MNPIERTLTKFASAEEYELYGLQPKTLKALEKAAGADPKLLAQVVSRVEADKLLARLDKLPEEVLRAGKNVARQGEPDLSQNVGVDVLSRYTGDGAWRDFATRAAELVRMIDKMWEASQN